MTSRSRPTDDPFEELLDAHARPVLRYVTSRVGADMAEDLVAETFLQAWAIRHRFDPELGSAQAWLLGIATNVIARHRQAETRWLRARALSVVVQSDRSDAAASSPEAVAIDRDSSARVLRELSRMSRRLRDALLLHELAGLPYEDVAAALGVPIGTVRSRINRARQQLERSSS